MEMEIVDTYHVDFSEYLPGNKTGSATVTVNDDAETVIVHHPVIEEEQNALIQAVEDTEGYSFIFLGYWIEDEVIENMEMGTYHVEFSRYLPGNKTGSATVTVNDEAKTVIVHHPVIEEEQHALRQAVEDTEGYNFIFLGYWIED